MSQSKFLPLPESVLPLEEGPQGYRLQRAGERGYVVISGFTQAAFVVTREGVVLVDAPPALDGKIQAAIASVTDQPVTHFIYTHSHLDHVGAVTKFPGARRIAHEEAARLLANHDAILATDFDTYVGGHVYRTGTRDDVQTSRDFLLDTIHTTQKAMGHISPADAAAGIDPANAWAVVTVWFDRIASAVTTELTQRWSDTIAAVDTFTPATVEALVVSLSTDAPAHLP